MMLTDYQMLTGAKYDEKKGKRASRENEPKKGKNPGKFLRLVQVLVQMIRSTHE